MSLAGRSRDQLADHGQRAVARAAHAEDDLERRIILVDERAQIFVQPRLGAVSGFSTETAGCAAGKPMRRRANRAAAATVPTR